MEGRVSGEVTGAYQAPRSEELWGSEGIWYSFVLSGARH